MSRSSTPRPSTSPIQRVGSIRVLGPLGQGGMGEVHLGWDERLQRKVALKAVRRDRIDSEARARLLREARILSSLDDPKICRFYDYVEGEDNDWLVLELAEGRSLDEVDPETLSQASRLEIAQQLAEVLVETHSQGIVHRDVKPANVMLQDDGTIKVLDFGIARFADGGPRERERTLAEGMRTPLGDAQTRFGELLGTLLYMSPEQARGEPVDETCDLYAFGLVLRRLFSGEPPYPPDLEGSRLLARVARGERPDPTAGGRIGGELARLIDELTDPKPVRRPSAAAATRRLAWERGRPKRRRRRLGIVAVIVTALGAGLLYTLDLRATMARSIAERARAEEARDEARELSSFLVGLFSTPPGASAETLTARGILERGALRLEKDLGDRPRLRSAVAFTLGEVYESLGHYEHSRELLEESLRLRQLDPERAEDLAQTLQALGSNTRFTGDYEQSLDYFERALELQLTTLGPEHAEVAETLNGMAIVARRQGRYEKAEELYTRSLGIREKVFGPEHPIVARSLNNLALLYYYQGRLEAAETVYRRALEIKESILEPNHPSLARGLNNLANVLTDRGRFDEAETYYRRNLEIWQEIGGPQHPETASAVFNLGLLYEESGRWEKAEEHLLWSIELRAETLGKDHPEYAAGLSSLSYLYILWRRFDEADERLGEALAVQRAVLSEDHPDLALSLSRAAALELGRERPAEALALAEQSLELNRSSLGEIHPSTAFSLYLAALAHLAEGDRDGADERFDRLEEIYRELGLQIAKHARQATLVEQARKAVAGDPGIVSQLVAPGTPEEMAGEPPA